jgi:hypothetical protein
MEEYLGCERELLLLERLDAGVERVVLRLERGVVVLELLGAPSRALVLEPDGHLARLQAQLPRQLRLLPGLQLGAPRVERRLQRPHLLLREPPLPLPADTATASPRTGGVGVPGHHQLVHERALLVLAMPRRHHHELAVALHALETERARPIASIDEAREFSVRCRCSPKLCQSGSNKLLLVDL